MPIKYNIIKNKNINIDNTIVEYDHNSIIIGFAIPRLFNGVDMTNKNIFIKFLDNKYNNGIIKCNGVYPLTKDILNLDEFDGDINNDYFFFQWVIDQTQTKIEGKLKVALEINQAAALKKPTTEQIALMPKEANIQKILENDDATISIYYYNTIAENFITMKVNDTNYLYSFQSNTKPKDSWVIPPKSGNIFTKYTGLFPIPADQMSNLTIYDSYNLNDIPSYLEQIIKSFGAYDRDYFRWSSLPFEITINKTIETLENSLDISNFIDLINEQYRYYPNTLTKVNTTIGEEASGNIEIDNKTHAMTLNLTLPRGEKGEQGPQGIQGLTGNKGSKGDKGDKGEKGDRGEKGEKGNAFTYNDFTPEQLNNLKGPKGEQGIPGEKGDKGDTGPAGYVLTDKDKTDIANKIDLPIQVVDDQWLDEQGISRENGILSLEDLSYTGKDWEDTSIAYYVLAYPYSLKFPIKDSTEYTKVELNIGAIIVAILNNTELSFVIDPWLGLFTCNFQPNQNYYDPNDLQLVNYDYLNYWTSNYMNHDVFSSTSNEAVLSYRQLVSEYDIGKKYCSYGILNKITFSGRMPVLKDMCGTNIIFQSGDTPTQIIIQSPLNYFKRLRFYGDDTEYLETSTGVYHNMFVPKANTLYKLSGLSIGDYYLIDIKAYK